jgi:hypothetical protein
MARVRVQYRLVGKYRWQLCSPRWLLFHLPFGTDLPIMLILEVIIIPYAFSRTQNTPARIFIHGIFSGPIFVVIALGWVK